MSTKNDGGPAFPQAETRDLAATEGMSLRDYLAAASDIPDAVVASAMPVDSDYSPEEWLRTRARLRYLDADLMLEAREQ